MRRVHAVLRTAVPECYALARTLKAAHPDFAWRFEDVGRELEASLDRTFSDLERKR